MNTETIIDRFIGDKRVGRFAVDLEVANYADILKSQEGTLSPDKIRRLSIDGIVDPGATRLVVPKALVDQLGLRVRRTKVKVRYADGRRALRNEVEAVWVKLQGRDGHFRAIVEPKRTTALIGERD